MNKKCKNFEVLLYLSLLGSAFIFCWQNITEYREGNTAYLDSDAHITLRDLPTLIICINRPQTHGKWMESKLTYGKTLSIEAIVNNHKEGEISNGLEQMVRLDENKWVSVLSSNASDKTWILKLHLSEMHLKLGDTIKSNGKYFFRQCYKISPKWSGNNDTAMKNFGLQFAIKCDLTQKLSSGWNSFNSYVEECDISKAQVYATSEENSYGFVEKKWFDGIVKNPEGIFVERTNDSESMYGDSLIIVEVNEYVNLDWKCSQSSYYESLVKRFENVVLDNNFHQNITNGLEICTPYILPPVRNFTFPVCRDENSFNVMSDILTKQYKDMEEHLKSCHVQEFKFGRREKLVFGKKQRPLVFEYRFASPHSTNFQRSRTPVKHVKTEYPLVSFISLVGIVGGTLGMFVGVSFMGIAEALVSIFSLKMQQCLKSFEKPKVQDEEI